MGLSLDGEGAVVLSPSIDGVLEGREKVKSVLLLGVAMEAVELLHSSAASHPLKIMSEPVGGKVGIAHPLGGHDRAVLQNVIDLVHQIGRAHV